MQDKKTKYTCQFCGHASNSLDDFEVDEQYHLGYWCPYCDGFTYFSNEVKHHQFFLILEDKNNLSCPKQNIKPLFKTQVSPLRYPGGKSKFVGQIISKCNADNMINFVEPFAGGASVGLSLLLSGKIQSLYLNDADFGIYSLFYTIKYFPQILIERIKTFIPSVRAFKKAKQKVSDGYIGLDMTDAAWNMLIVNRLSFSGIAKANCMSNPSARWNPKSLIKKINAIHNYSDRIFISNQDAYTYIEEMYWLPNTTMFIDPPYYENGKYLYNLFYSDKEHRKLSFLLDDLYKGMPGADMILTYDFCSEIESMYEYPKISIIGRKYSIANH